jgi:hypothetical protein
MKVDKSNIGRVCQVVLEGRIVDVDQDEYLVELGGWFGSIWRIKHKNIIVKEEPMRKPMKPINEYSEMLTNVYGEDVHRKDEIGDEFKGKCPECGCNDLSTSSTVIDSGLLVVDLICNWCQCYFAVRMTESDIIHIQPNEADPDGFRKE